MQINKRVTDNISKGINFSFCISLMIITISSIYLIMKKLPLYETFLVYMSGFLLGLGYYVKREIELNWYINRHFREWYEFYNSQAPSIMDTLTLKGAEKRAWAWHNIGTVRQKIVLFGIVVVLLILVYLGDMIVTFFLPGGFTLSNGNRLLYFTFGLFLAASLSEGWLWRKYLIKIINEHTIVGSDPKVEKEIRTKTEKMLVKTLIFTCTGIVMVLIGIYLNMNLFIILSGLLITALGLGIFWINIKNL